MEIACSDNNCVFKTSKGGMGTNGGCDCLMDVKGGTPRVEMRRKIRVLVSEIQEDTKLIANLKQVNLNLTEAEKEAYANYARVREQLEVARRDAQDWIAVAKDQERVIDELQKQVEYLKDPDALDIEDLDLERVKYRRALVEIESVLRGRPTEEGVDYIKRLLDNTLKLDNP